ncbi:hypothetical protein BDV19DRAFT_155589 [Aspergillus venezuelensis]
MRGTEEDKSFNMLVSRVACIGKLRHKDIGYSGPLSRQLLSYRSLITEVRSTLRNLIEIVLVSVLLNGDASRDRNDWNDIGKFPTSQEARDEVKTKGKDWFQHSDSFTGNLEIAFKLWDAVYKGSQSAGKEFKDGKLWADANKWLSERR